MPLNSRQLETALRACAARLAGRSGGGSVRILVVGGTAGLLGGLLRGSRTTGDCDVMAVRPEGAWPDVERAAAAVAKEMKLPENWLNTNCRAFAWSMPLGWEGRCEPVGDFGLLEVWRASRIDLIASKIVAAPKRPQDIEDVRDMRPTADELDFVQEHIDRLERESLDADASFDAQRAIVDVLRGEL